MSPKPHRQSHYFEVLNLLALAAIILFAVGLQEQMNVTIATLFSLVYFAANIAYAAHTQLLDTTRVVEVGVIALICEFVLISYVI